MRNVLLFLFCLTLTIGMVTAANADTDVADKAAQIELGETLYHDTSLSKNGDQSCATCHNPDGGFVDDRAPVQAVIDAGWPASIAPPVSQGSDKNLFGGRNTPSAAYAAFSPSFHFNEVDGLYVGGQFLDGRELSLAGQAAGPFRNPVEMAMEDKKAVVRLLKWNANYRKLFAAAYKTEDGPYNLWFVSTLINQHVLETYDLMAKAIGEFEKTQEFNKFNSKYDYYLAYDEPLTAKEERGRRLFNNKGMCALCHISEPAFAPDGGMMPPLLTDFTYDNLGIPKNEVIDNLLGEPQPADRGLGLVLNDTAQDGKFKVMSLRNIELTAPYGHNGFFPTLESIVRFYNTAGILNCETVGGTPVTPADLANGDLPELDNNYCWPEAEFTDTLNRGELGDLGLTAAQELKIVAFLKTLTDRGDMASTFVAGRFPPMP